MQGVLCYNKIMKKFFSLLVSVLAAAVVFIGLRMLTIPTDLTLTQTYTLPVFPNLSEIITDHDNIKQAVAIDGQVAYSNQSTAQPTASTAKMLTALMVMEKKPFNLGETGGTITITPEFYQQYLWYLNHNGSNAAVRVGEQISEYDAIAAALLPSSNNFADTLAIWAFGSLEAYRDYATTRLDEWGITDTVIGLDASGYSETTTSTAADLALIGQKVMENPVLAEIVGLKSRTIPVAGIINNTNQLLGVDGIVGIKTGYIGDASGYCLISAYYLNDHIVTLAILNAPTRAASFSVSQEIIESLQANFNETRVVSAGEQVGYYDSWWTGQIPVTTTTDLSVLGWQDAPTTAVVNMNSDQTSGELVISTNDTTYRAPVVSENLQFEPSFWQRFLYAINLMP